MLSSGFDLQNPPNLALQLFQQCFFFLSFFSVWSESMECKIFFPPIERMANVMIHGLPNCRLSAGQSCSTVLLNVAWRLRPALRSCHTV